MSKGVSFQFENGVVWLGLSELGACSVSVDLANQISDSLDQALALDGLNCVVLSGAPKGFPRGFASTDVPNLDDLDVISACFTKIENFPIPVVAVVPDAAINEGLELALAAHFRIAAKTARFGYNHIATGLIPGLGGSQRLPRLTGAKTALEVLLNGKLFTAEKAQECGLVDLVSQSDLTSEVVSFVQNLIDNQAKPRPTGRLVSGQSDPQRYQSQMNEAKKLVEGFGLPAANAIVECIEAAQITPIETGLGIERSKYVECVNSGEAKSLRHIALAERRLSRPGQRAGGFVSVCILAAKAEDAGLCVAMLDAGLDVTIVDHVAPPHPSMSGAVAKIYDQAVQAGRMSPEIRAARLARMNVVLREEEPTHADVYIDAGRFPQGEVLDWLTGALENTSSQRLILTARTSQEASDLAEVLPDGLKGAAFYFERAPHISKIVEVFPIAGQPAEAIEDIQEFFRITRRLPIAVEDSSEPIGSLIRHRFIETAETLLLHGAEPKQIDGALGAFGFRKGPMAMRDEVGLEMDLIPGKQPATEALIKAGRTGREAGLGYFRYAKGDPRPRPDGVVVWSLSSTRDRLDIEPYDFTDSDITELFIGALVNLGAELLEDDKLQRASDFDVLAIHSIGFPRRKGGPMQAAEQIGLFKIMQKLKQFSYMNTQIWGAHPMIAELVKYGQGFEDMNLPELDAVS